MRTRSIRKASRRTIAVAQSLAQELRQKQLQLTGKPPPPLPELAADFSPVPLALLSRGGVFVSVASSLFPLLNAVPGEVIHQPLADFIQPRDARSLFKLLTACLQTGQPCRAEFSMGLPGRPAKDILLVLSPVQPAQPHAAFRAAFVDLGTIEARHLGPRPPHQNARLIEAVDGIIWEADYPRQFTFVSSQAERILGLSPDDWMRDPDFWQSHIFHEDRERVLQARADAAKEPLDHVLEYRMLTAARKTVWVKDSAVILAAGPGWVRMGGIIMDTTDLQTARQNLQRANQNLEAAVAQRTAKMEQSLEAMQTLCYGIAHDLKAPIRGLQGFVGLLTADYHTVFDDNAKYYTQRCQVALDRMNSLIEAILAYGRLNHTLPQLIPLDPRHVIQRVLDSLEADIAATHAKIHVQIAMPRVIGNPSLLEQILANLIANALKFVQPGAHPEISISAVDTGQNTDVGPQPSVLSPQPSTVRLTITDNGIGIPPHAAQRLFGMFQKLHHPEEYPGTGIGLAVVKRAIELMNGRAGLFSEPGHGSSFWIELPSASD